MAKRSQALYDLMKKWLVQGEPITNDQKDAALKFIFLDYTTYPDNVINKPKELSMFEAQIQLVKEAVDAAAVSIEAAATEKIKTEKEASWQEGHDAAVDGGASGAKWTDEEVNAMLKVKDDEIAALKAQLDQAALELPGKLEIAKVEAVVAFKQEVLPKVDTLIAAQQDSESKSESELKDAVSALFA